MYGSVLRIVCGAYLAVMFGAVAHAQSQSICSPCDACHREAAGAYLVRSSPSLDGNLWSTRADDAAGVDPFASEATAAINREVMVELLTSPDAPRARRLSTANALDFDFNLPEPTAEPARQMATLSAGLPEPVMFVLMLTGAMFAVARRARRDDHFRRLPEHAAHRP